MNQFLRNFVYTLYRRCSAKVMVSSKYSCSETPSLNRSSFFFNRMWFISFRGLCFSHRICFSIWQTLKFPCALWDIFGKPARVSKSVSFRKYTFEVYEIAKPHIGQSESIFLVNIFKVPFYLTECIMLVQRTFLAVNRSRTFVSPLPAYGRTVPRKWC